MHAVATPSQKQSLHDQCAMQIGYSKKEDWGDSDV